MLCPRRGSYSYLQVHLLPFERLLPFLGSYDMQFQQPGKALASSGVKNFIYSTDWVLHALTATLLGSYRP